MAVLLATALWPGAATAEGGFLAALLDSLDNPNASADELVDALESAGFIIDVKQTIGPEVSQAEQTDGYYYYLAANAAPGAALAPDGKPEMSLTCSRIGQSTRKAIVDGAVISGLQTWSTVVDFEPGAVAQLKCEVKLYPRNGAVLPTDSDVRGAIEMRFSETWNEVGTSQGPRTSLAWIHYPPEEHMDQVAPLLQVGQTLIAGRNPALAGLGKPDWIVYDHFQADVMHRFVLTSHIPLTSSQSRRSPLDPPAFQLAVKG